MSDHRIEDAPDLAPQRDWERREFLRRVGQLGLGLTLCPFALGAAPPWPRRGRRPRTGPRREVYYYTKLPGGRVQCQTCPHKCTLSNGQLGRCRSKKNIAGKHYLESYGRLCVLNLDPIEKGPLYHVHPGAKVMSVAAGGCNLHCVYCQNWEFSQKEPGQVAKLDLPPQTAAAKAKEHGCKGITFTYTDPVAYYEYARDTAEKVEAAGLINAFCSAGYIQREPLVALCKHATSFTVTLKAFSERRYKDLCEVSMQPVLDAMQTVKEQGVWLEIVSLIVPGYNDRIADVKKRAKWIERELGPDVPWHFSRFVPAYKMRTKPPTPTNTLDAARAAALDAGLRYVYVTNVAPHEGNHTYCPKCGRKVIERLGFKVLKQRMKAGRCAYCRAKIAGVWT